MAIDYYAFFFAVIIFIGIPALLSAQSIPNDRNKIHLYSNFEKLNHDLFKPLLGVEGAQVIKGKITFYVFYQSTVRFVGMEGKDLDTTLILPGTKIEFPGFPPFLAPAPGIKVSVPGNQDKFTPVFSVLKDGKFQFCFFGVKEKEGGGAELIKGGPFEWSGVPVKEFANWDYQILGEILDCVFLKQKSYDFLMNCVKKGSEKKREYPSSWNYRTDYFWPDLAGDGSPEVVLRYKDGSDYFYQQNGLEITEQRLFGPAVIGGGTPPERHGFTSVEISEIQNPKSLKKYLVLNINEFGPEAMNAEVTETKKIFNLINGRLEIVRGKKIDQLLK